MIQEDDIERLAGGVTEAAVADAAAGMAAGRARRGGEHCRNCGAPLTGRYCGSCGQLADDYQRPLWRLIAEIVGDLFAIEGRFARTVPTLLFRPGRVSARYLAGHRADYVPPFRLFLVASVVFFLAAWSFTPTLDAQEMSAGAAGNTLDAESGQQFRDEVKCAIAGTFIPDVAPSETCAALIDAGEIEVQSDMDFSASLSLEDRVWITGQLQTAVDRPEDWVAAMQRWSPRLVFVLCPLFAIYLGLLHFWRRKLYFFNHLVVSLHFHAFLFLWALLCMAATVVIPGWLAFLVFLAWANVALYRTLREAYGDGRVLAVARVLLLDLANAFTLSFAALALMALGVAFV